MSVLGKGVRLRIGKLPREWDKHCLCVIKTSRGADSLPFTHLVYLLYDPQDETDIRNDDLSQ